MKSPPLSVSGFTITELLVVMAIAGVLAAIAVPSFKSLSQSQQVRNAVYSLYATLNLARSEAIKRNSNVTVAPVSAGSWQSGWNVSASGVPTITIETQGALGGIVISRAPASVIYAGNGRLAAAATSFQIDVSATQTANVSCVRIELSGMPRVLKGACP